MYNSTNGEPKCENQTADETSSRALIAKKEVL